ncbi:uncharacterized protein LOC127079059 [Lathyrus oleraceus]|uniref:uncharacterized protein LOC127079059 n=1 Tax=Pisum sativum TaxID=3888 RepID=UPI0021D28054|nr:uncharacterized protein LOC127079059 [Pisum sativum]
MTPIETDEDVKSMFQCHITLSQLPTIEIYVRLVENLEEQPSHNENVEEQPTHNENLCYPTQSVQSHDYRMSQAIDEEPTQNNEPFIPNEEVGENSEDDLEEVRFEDLFGVSDDDGNEDIFDTPTVALRVQPISLYNPPVHMQNISLDDAELISVFGSFIPTHNADEIEEGIEYENKEECVLALQQWHIKHSLDFSVVKSDNVKVIITHVAEKYRYIISYKKAWIAKCKAIESLYGNWETSYNDLSQWILVDGTWLYGKYRRTLLMDVAQDGNENIFPIAFALVESETKEAWSFFLKNLRIHVTPQANQCLISDKHESIKSAYNNPENGWQYPPSSHVYCIRLIAQNFMREIKDKDLRKIIVNMGYALIEAKFNYYQGEIRRTNNDALSWIDNNPQEK